MYTSALGAMCIFYVAEFAYARSYSIFRGQLDMRG